jgi:hypothetical protein
MVIDTKANMASKKQIAEMPPYAGIISTTVKG